MFRRKVLYHQIFKYWKISFVLIPISVFIHPKNKFLAKEDKVPIQEENKQIVQEPKEKSSIYKMINDLYTYLTSFNVFEVEKYSREQLNSQIEKLSPQFDNLKKSLHEISENTEKEVGEIEIKVPKKSVLKMIPGFNYVLTNVEHLYKCFIFTMIGYSLDIISKSENEDIKRDLSKIIIENSLKPIEMSIDLMDYISKRNLWIDKDSKAISNIKEYYKYINLFSKLFE